MENAVFPHRLSAIKLIFPRTREKLKEQSRYAEQHFHLPCQPVRGMFNGKTFVIKLFELNKLSHTHTHGVAQLFCIEREKLINLKRKLLQAGQKLGRKIGKSKAGQGETMPKLFTYLCSVHIGTLGLAAVSGPIAEASPWKSGEDRAQEDQRTNALSGQLEKFSRKSQLSSRSGCQTARLTE